MLISEIVYNIIYSSLSSFKYICLTSVIDNYLMKKITVKYIVDDPRSAGYIATGMAAELLEPVVLCCRNNIESRSILSAMTEAYYRNLPILALLISDKERVNNSRGLNDTFKHNFEIRMNDELCIINRTIDDIVELLETERMPISLHIDISNDYEYMERTPIYNVEENKVRSHILEDVCLLLNDRDYLYVSNKFDLSDVTYKCKVYTSSRYSSNEGSIATVLGAALSQKHDRYIAFVSEDEFVHDINTLGNRCLLNNIIIVVEAKGKKEVIADYAKSVGFTVIYNLDIGSLENKTVVVM